MDFLAMNDSLKNRYIVEFQSVGNMVKVSAICPRTHEEVCFTGPANASQDMLSRTAVQKLEYVLKKKGL